MGRAERRKRKAQDIKVETEIVQLDSWRGVLFSILNIIVQFFFIRVGQATTKARLAGAPEHSCTNTFCLYPIIPLTGWFSPMLPSKHVTKVIHSDWHKGQIVARR